MDKLQTYRTALDALQFLLTAKIGLTPSMAIVLNNIANSCFDILKDEYSKLADSAGVSPIDTD